MDEDDQIEDGDYGSEPLGCNPQIGNFTDIVLAEIGDGSVYTKKLTVPIDDLTDVQLQCDGAGEGAVARCVNQYNDTGSNAYNSPWFRVEYSCGTGDPEESVDTYYNQTGVKPTLDCSRSQARCLGGEIRVYDNGLIWFVHAIDGAERDVRKVRINESKLYKWEGRTPETVYTASSSLYEGRGEVPTGESYTLFKIDKSKPGQNGILENGDYIGSPSGKFYVQFVYDGNDGMGRLVAFSVEPACQPEDLANRDRTMTSRDADVRAPYKMKEGLSKVDLANEMAYVDTYDRLRFFDQPPSELSDKYYSAGNYAMTGDVDPIATSGDRSECKQKCNDTEDCYGYVQDSNGCKLYGRDSMYPTNLNRLDGATLADASMFVRLHKTINQTDECSKDVVGVTQSRIAGNKKVGNLTRNSKCRVAEYTEEEVRKVNSLTQENNAAMDMLGDEAKRLADGNVQMEESTNDAIASQKAAERSMDGIVEQRDKIEKMQTTVLGMDESATSQMLSNNYNMLLWTTIGIGSAAICMHLAR